MFDLHKGGTLTPKAEASVIRNVAGRPQLSLSDIIAITELAPITDIMLLHHSGSSSSPLVHLRTNSAYLTSTDCGATHFTEQSMKAQVKARVPGHDAALEAMYFGEIVGGDLAGSVRADVEFLRASPFVKAELTLHGYVIDIVTGKLQTVVA
ncbi:hypothetical protein MMC34_006915 [Xylographa carneopallida]|nr:hypothetical protein [Xylographa carneopallida]